MNRREFVKWSGLFAASTGLDGWKLPAAPASVRPADFGFLLDPVNLRERIRLAQGALVGILDSSRRHLPYWSCEFDHGDFTHFQHGPYDGEGVWDRMHNSGRVLHGLTMAEAVTGVSVDPEIIADLTHYLVGLFSAGDGLPGDSGTTSGRRVVSLHNLREALNGLTALIRRDDPQAPPLARQLVRTLRGSLDATGRIHLERLPAYLSPYTSQPHMEGRAVDALVRYFRVSGDVVALETAGLLTEFALEHCFAASGALTPLAGTHGHSINVLVAGMIGYALEVKDPVLLARARRAFDLGLASFNTSFGWSMESLHRRVLRGEANNTGDLLRASLLLGQAGFPEYYGRAERILRSHLLPSQWTEVTGYSDNPAATEDCLRSLASRARGGFAVPTPNDHQFEPNAPLSVCDITSGAVDALCETQRAMVEEGPGDVRLHLLLSREGAPVSISSGLPRDGRVEITDHAGRNLWVRLPPWVVPATVNVRAGEAAVARRVVGSYLFIPGTGTARTVTVRFPPHKERTTESIVGQVFTIDWHGDQIVAMSPPVVPSPSGAPIPRRCRPMFPRCQLRATQDSADRR